MRGAILLLISMLIVGCVTVINSDEVEDLDSTPDAPSSSPLPPTNSEVPETTETTLEPDEMSISLSDIQTKGLAFQKLDLDITNKAGQDVVNFFCDFEFRYGGEIVESSERNNILGYEERLRNGQTVTREFQFIKEFQETGEYELNVVCYPAFDENLRVSAKEAFSLETLSDEFAILDTIDPILKEETYCTYKCLMDFSADDNKISISLKMKTKAYGTAQADEFNALSISANLFKEIWPNFASVSQISIKTYVDFDKDEDGTKEDVLIQTSIMERSAADGFDWKSLRVDIYTTRDIKDSLLGYSFDDSIYPIPKDYV